jgi:hypothetical protein
MKIAIGSDEKSHLTDHVVALGQVNKIMIQK